MRRYLSGIPRKEYPADVRIVHNFYPGPADDPGADRQINVDGFPSRDLTKLSIQPRNPLS